MVVIRQLQAAHTEHTLARTRAESVALEPQYGMDKEMGGWSRWWDERKLALPGTVMVSKK